MAQVLRGFLARGIYYPYGDDVIGNNNYATGVPNWSMVSGGVLVQGNGFFGPITTGAPNYKLQTNGGYYNRGTYSADNFWIMNPGLAGGMGLGSGNKIMWASSTTNTGDSSGVGIYGDVGLMRSAAGVLEINQGTLGTQRDLKLRDIFTTSTAFLHRIAAAITGGGTSQTPTLTAGPVAGNPTKWMPIDDNGTTRYLPAW